MNAASPSAGDALSSDYMSELPHLESDEAVSVDLAGLPDSWVPISEFDLQIDQTTATELKFWGSDDACPFDHLRFHRAASGRYIPELCRIVFGHMATSVCVEYCSLVAYSHFAGVTP